MSLVVTGLLLHQDLYILFLCDYTLLLFQQEYLLTLIQSYIFHAFYLCALLHWIAILLLLTVQKDILLTTLLLISNTTYSFEFYEIFFRVLEIE